MLAILLAASWALSGCVDPNHSRFANKGPCEVSTGSRFCASGDGEATALDIMGDSDLRQDPGPKPDKGF